MANANLRQRPNGRWECRWQALDGRRRSKSFVTKSEAAAFQDGIVREQVLLGRTGHAHITVATFIADKWWPAVEVRVAASTAARWDAEIRNHVLPHLARRRLSEVRVEDIDVLFRHRASEGAAHETILKLRSVLSNIWSEAQRLGYVDGSPVTLSRVPTRRRSRQRDEAFTLEEVREIAAEAAKLWPGYAGPILIAAGAGLRWGEVCALRPDDIDLATGYVVVDKSLAEVRGGFLLKDPKSIAGDRVAIFDAAIKQDLTIHLEEWSLPHIAFPGPRGGYLRRSNFTRRVFRPAVTDAGFESPNTFHSLRRTYATSLMEQQIEPRAIADLLGHAQVSTSMDLYASRFSGQTARLAERLGHRRLRAVT